MQSPLFVTGNANICCVMAISSYGQCTISHTGMTGGGAAYVVSTLITPYPAALYATSAIQY
jgi:hypothetical protein